MKKTVLFTVALLMFIVLKCKAQEITYGVRLGANLSSISSDDIPENLKDSRFGIVAGFLAEVPINQKWSIQPEFQYSSLGNDDESLRVDYLQLPIILKYNFSKLFNVHVGPQVGLKIWEWEDNSEGEINFNTFNLSAVAGIGVSITENFFADLRYGFGVSNIIDDQDIPKGAKGSNRNIQLSFGYKL